jgi:trk system potassium uptake protein TrkA
MRLPKVSSGGNRDEFAVIGLGRFGSSLARTLVSRGASVLGIDRSPEPVQELADELTQTVVLDATNEAALREVDIAVFSTVIVAIGSNFEANLLTTVALRELGVNNIICKALNLRQRDILLKVGANRVVLPEYEAATVWRLNSPSLACSDRLI